MLLILTALLSVISINSSADTAHTVVRGDTMWLIAVKHEVGISELILANPHIKNPDLIYPGQVINIPTLAQSVLAYEAEVVRLVNDIRKANGLKELVQDWELSRVARYKSQDMSDGGYLSHQSPTYGSPFAMMKNFGISYRSAGENIARGYTTPAAVVNGWMNSSGHRANVLNPNFTHIGVGYVSSGSYWTQMFILK